MTTLKELKEATPEALKDINALIHQLSERLPDCTMQLLESIVTDTTTELWVVEDGERIIGMATLVIVTIPEGQRAQIEDVVVDEKYRGQGLGEELSKKLIERAKMRKVPSITLSSRAERVAANKLYQKLGFTNWPTNVYKLKL